MNMYSTIMSVIIIGLILYAFVRTLIIGKNQKQLQGNYDSPLPREHQNHLYKSNPIFLAYIVFFTISILAIIYFAMKYYS